MLKSVTFSVFFVIFASFLIGRVGIAHHHRLNRARLVGDAHPASGITLILLSYAENRAI